MLLNQLFVDPVMMMLGEWAVNVTPGSIAIRILISVLLATVMGCERSRKRHAAGLRTFVITGLSSTAAMLMDCVFAAYSQVYFYPLSAATIIAVAVISVNSVLYSSKNQIKGLTTAAALWGTAVLGLTAGAGFITLTLITFALLMVTLSILPSFERDLKNRSDFFEVHLELTGGQHLREFIATSRKLGLAIDDIEVNPAYAGSGLSVYTVSLSVQSAELKQYKTHSEIIEALSTLGYVHYIEEIQY